jgi:hypothetical protein
MVDWIIAGGIIVTAALLLLWLKMTKQLDRKAKKAILFAAFGAEVFHAVVHAYLWWSNQTFFVPWLVVTPVWSLGSAIVNGLIALGLLLWALKE